MRMPVLLVRPVRVGVHEGPVRVFMDVSLKDHKGSCENDEAEGSHQAPSGLFCEHSKRYQSGEHRS